MSGLEGSRLTLVVWPSARVEINVIDDANDNRTHRRFVVIENLSGTAALVEDQDGLALACTDGVEGNIYVKLNVNGELKTTNGLAADGTNEYSFFKVTPGGM